ncbi:MAG: M28 family peptidase, partial [Terracidiphilus sp.]
MRSQCPIILLILSVGVALGQSTSPIPPDAKSAIGELRKEPFRAHMAFLADDLLEGRGTGKRGHEIAARYVAAQFEAMGLQPAGVGGTYFQRVPMREIYVESEKCAMAIAGSGGVASTLKWGEDFVMFRDHAGIADEDTLDAPLIFAGYGVRTPDGSYDDYSGLDVKGKIVLLLSGAPHLLSSELSAHLAESREKLRAARDHGAVGVVFIWTPQVDKIYAWPHLARDASIPSMSWLDPAGLPGDSFPDIRVIAYVSAAAAKKLFQHVSKSWTEVLRDADASKPQGFALNLTAHMRLVSHHSLVSSPNVLAVLTGSDSKLSHEYVVYSAHVDHLGIGEPVNGDSIYNGALDDASGVAALLVIAKAFKSLAHAPARSILFFGATGEEPGMLGSDYFAHFPT